MPATPPHIEELLNDCLAGNRLAQRTLYERFLPYALTVARRFGVASRYQADVMQEIFSEVFVKLPKFDPTRGSFTTWLRAIAVRRTIDFLRKREKFRLTELVALVPDRGPAVPLSLDDVPTDELLLAMNALPGGCRMVFNLYAVDGCKHQEIAEMLGISASASRAQYARARERLRNHLSISKKKIKHEYR